MKFLPLKVLILVLPLIAHAHHPMGGEVPATMAQGLLSGLGHPIIELDHLLFIVAFAALLAFCSLHIMAHLGLFITLALIGTLGRLIIPDLPLLEVGILASTLVAGLLLIFRRLDYVQALWLLAPLAGLIHGYAYGAAVVGAENTPLFGYLSGVFLIQAALILSVAFGIRNLNKHFPATAVRIYRPVSGAAVIVFGLIV